MYLFRNLLSAIYASPDLIPFWDKNNGPGCSTENCTPWEQHEKRTRYLPRMPLELALTARSEGHSWNVCVSLFYVLHHFLQRQDLGGKRFEDSKLKPLFYWSWFETNRAVWRVLAKCFVVFETVLLFLSAICPRYGSIAHGLVWLNLLQITMLMGSNFCVRHWYEQKGM